MLWICLPWLGSAASSDTRTDATKPAEAKAILTFEQKDLTPEGLTRFFADFTYELGEHVQSPEAFLIRKRGDCDDFAKLVSTVLDRHGYRTKLVVVMMEQQTHVVCYVNERHGYLDYNFRAEEKPVIESDGTLEDIAQKVAGSFRSEWRMASVVRFEGDRPVFMDTVFAPRRSNQLQASDKAGQAPGVMAAEAASEAVVEKTEQGKPDAAAVRSVPESPTTAPRG